MDEQRKVELQQALKKMRAVSDQFYRGAVHTGVHPFIEFCGFMNEYISVCQRSLEKGIDFAQASAHSGLALDMASHHALYLAEKFDCIFGPTLRANPDHRDAFWNALQGDDHAAEPRN